MCLACFFLVFSACGVGIAITTIGREAFNGSDDGGDNIKPASANLTFMLNDVLGTGLDFSKYASTDRNTLFQQSYEALD